MPTFDDVTKLREARDTVEEMVKENFGYCPNGENFNRAMDNMSKYEGIVKKDWPKEWAEYQNKYY